MNTYTYITLRDKPELKDNAAKWFSNIWNVPVEEYLKCIDAYLNKETEYGWYLCLDKEKIISGLGVIKNDFHDRKDLYPNICAVYTLEEYRNQGIMKELLNMTINDLKSKSITPVYVLTDLIGFYEQYGFEFYTLAKNEFENSQSRLLIHR